MTVLLLLTICLCYFAFAVFIGKVIALANRPLTRAAGFTTSISRASRTSVVPLSHVRLRLTAPVPLVTRLTHDQRGRLHVKAPLLIALASTAAIGIVAVVLR